MKIQIHRYKEIDSTNLEVIRRIKQDAPEGTLVQAVSQTNGRGRRGRTWESPAGSDLYMSLLLRPKVSLETSAMVTLIMALACVEGIQKMTGLSCGIKWPNDVVYDGKKLVGILTEASMLADGTYALSCGVGINVSRKCFSDELLDKATSLEQHLQRKLDTDQLRDVILAFFLPYYERFLEIQNLSFMKDSYEHYLLNKDREVRVLDPKGEYDGIALGIDNAGQLLVKTKEDITAVYAGEVSVRGLYEYV